MDYYVISEAIGYIAGSAYEGRTRRIIDYDKVKLFCSRTHFADYAVLYFACAEAFVNDLDMTVNLWITTNEQRYLGYYSKFQLWMASLYK